MPEKNREALALLLDACGALQREDHDVIYASMIKDTMKRKKPSFDESYYGYRSFTHLLEDAGQLGIADIERDPGRYQNKDVVVAGVVKDSYGLSIPGTRIGGGAYQIDDGTGTIWVLVTEGNVPAKGAQVGVKGRVGSGVSWKGRNYGLGIYEKDRRYPKR